MHCVKQTVKAKAKTITILRNTPLNGIRVVERSAKTLKDPNPLASTMVGLSRKFPISIDRSKAAKFKVPISLLHIANKKQVEDMHEHDRILYKKEVIDWWVSRSPLPNQDSITSNAIDIIYRQPRADSEAYYGIRWFESAIQYAPPILERTPVPTRIVEVNIPKDKRTDAVIQTLLSEHTIHFPMGLEANVTALKHLADTIASTMISLQTSARILLSSMDPRVRYLPVESGQLEKFASMKLALVQIRSRVIPRVMPNIGTSAMRDTQIRLLGKIFIHMAKTSHATEAVVRQAVSQTTVLEVKWIKTALHIPSSMEFTRHGLTISPVRAAVRGVAAKTGSGVRFTRYEGREEIHFKYKGMKGSFTKEDDLLSNVVTNYTNIADLTIY